MTADANSSASASKTTRLRLFFSEAAPKALACVKARSAATT